MSALQSADFFSRFPFFSQIQSWFFLRYLENYFLQRESMFSVFESIVKV
jgi:hypothetical protein